MTYPWYLVRATLDTSRYYYYYVCPPTLSLILRGSRSVCYLSRFRRWSVRAVQPCFYVFCFVFLSPFIPTVSTGRGTFSELLQLLSTAAAAVPCCQHAPAHRPLLYFHQNSTNHTILIDGVNSSSFSSTRYTLFTATACINYKYVSCCYPLRMILLPDRPPLPHTMICINPMHTALLLAFLSCLDRCGIPVNN